MTMTFKGALQRARGVGLSGGSIRDQQNRSTAARAHHAALQASTAKAREASKRCTVKIDTLNDVRCPNEAEPGSATCKDCGGKAFYAQNRLPTKYA